MKQIFLFASFLFLANVSFSQQTDCKKFRTGTFQNVEDGVVRTNIKRTKKFQYEEYDHVKIKLKVEWIDDCSYKLIFLDGNDAWWDLVGRDKESPDLIVRITGIEGDSYLQESKFVGDELCQKSSLSAKFYFEIAAFG